MRLDALLAEAMRNLMTGTSRAITSGVVLALITALTCASDALVVSQLVERAEAYRAAGASTYVVDAAHGVSATACEAQASSVGVEAAGALRAASDLTMPLLPSRVFRQFEVTPGFAGVLGAGNPRGGLLVSSEVADDLSVQVGDELVLSNRTGRIAGIFEHPADGRDTRLSAAVVSIVAPRGHFDQCWSRVWPQDDARTAALRLTLLPDAPSPTLGQLNATLGQTFTGPTDFATRTTRFAAPAGVLVAAALGLAWIALRRRELVMARAVGVRRPDLALQLQVEAIVIGVVATTLGMTIAALSVSDTPELLAMAAKPGIAVGVAWVLGATLGAALLRPERVLRYVKYD